MAEKRSMPARNKPLWLRFVLAFLWLMFAFASAIFSTVAREQGHFWATLALATLALLLATVVGLTTVPVLARQVMGNRVRDVFHFDVTRVGILYVTSIVLIGIAALNTGNNLLYIIVAVMLGAILVSGIASAVILRNVQVEVRVAERIFAGRPEEAEVRVRNTGSRLPLFSLLIRPIASAKSRQWQWVRSTFTFPPVRIKSRVWLTLPDRQLKRVPPSSSVPVMDFTDVYFPFVAPRGEQSAKIEVKFARRGCYQSSIFAAHTRFPFAFLAKTRHNRAVRKMMVYPRLLPGMIEAIWPQMTGQTETSLRGRGSDLYKVREYQAQDSVRHVDWKATAKAGALMVREFTRDEQSALRIVFDNPAPGVVPEAHYENGVSMAASLAWYLSSQGKNVFYLAPGFQNEQSVDCFLSYLVTIEPAKEQVMLDRLPQDGALNIIVTARSPGTFEGALPDRCMLFTFGKSLITEEKVPEMATDQAFALE